MAMPVKLIWEKLFCAYISFIAFKFETFFIKYERYKALVMSRYIAFCLCPGAPLFCIAAGARGIAPRQSLQWRRCFIDGHFSVTTITRSATATASPGRSTVLEWPRPVIRISPSSSRVSGPGEPNAPAVGIDAWLQRQARAGRKLGGISNGAFVLARNGWLDDQYSRPRTGKTSRAFACSTRAFRRATSASSSTAAA